jgi:nitrogen-specific signal transduction histidine kinase
MRKEKKSEILYGSENAVGRGIEFMRNTESKMDITFDYKAPSIVVRIPQYREGYLDILKRGGIIRCITEVTPDNIGDCKELLNLVTELRHMDGMKGGIAINESEYMATTVLKESKPLTEVIYSNADEVVAQGQYIFDTMWKNATPAIKKIKEIEEGKPIEYITKILSRSDGSLKESSLQEFFYKIKKVDVVTSSAGLSRGYDFFRTLNDNLIKEKENSDIKKHLRVLVEVSKDNIQVVKKYINSNIEVRHLKKEPTIYFAVTDLNLLATIERMEIEDTTESILYSNDPQYINRFKMMFERLWNDSRSAEEAIGFIENNEVVPVLETIESSERTLLLIKELISSAKNELLGILPTFDAFQRQVDNGIFDHIRKVSQRNKINIKILVTDKIDFPDGKGDRKVGKNNKHIITIRRKNLQKTKAGSEDNEFTIDSIEGLTIRSINSQSIRPQLGLVIVDRSKSIIVESKKTKSEKLIDHIGMSSYSNSNHISESYGTIFLALWNYSKMFDLMEKSYKRLRIQDAMQREFVDIVAHELRTPLQSILGLTDVVKERTSEEDNKRLLETVRENGARLYRFVENVLTATKLEGLFSQIPREVFALDLLIKDIVKNYETKFQNIDKLAIPKIKEIHFDLKGFDKEYKINANKLQISMVITNLIDNAVNFIPSRKKGIISIVLEQKEDYVIVHIMDNGEGIHPEILPRLFTKFATKSFYGSGLGLYNCRKIIHMHNGGIWAQNNPREEGGAIFSFQLPLIV